MSGEMLTPKGGHGYERSEALLVVTRDEATIIGVLPDREARA
jgi:hypothetical protein